MNEHSAQPDDPSKSLTDKLVTASKSLGRSELLVEISKLHNGPVDDDWLLGWNACIDRIISTLGTSK